MIRRLVTFLCVLSLLLCTGTCALWIRSYWKADILHRAKGNDLYEGASYRGVLLFSRYLDGDGAAASYFPSLTWETDEARAERGYEDEGDSSFSVCRRKSGMLGFGYSRHATFDGLGYTLTVPFWFIALVTSGAQLMELAGVYRSRRQRSFTRRVFTFLAALSLALCAGTLILWVPSAWDRNYAVIVDVYGTDWQFVSDDQGLSLAAPASPRPSAPVIAWAYAHGVTPKVAVYSATYWQAAVATAVLPLVWCAIRLRPFRRRIRGLCPKCGYNLRATPERCPECGMVPTGAKGAA